MLLTQLLEAIGELNKNSPVGEWFGGVKSNTRVVQPHLVLQEVIPIRDYITCFHVVPFSNDAIVDLDILN